MSRAQQFEIFASGALYLGVPVATGYARFYAAGTTTLKNAYEDKLKAVSCTTKTLDAEGRAEVFGDGIYKIRIYEGDPDDGGTLRVEIDDYKCTAVEGDVTTVTANYTVDRDDRLVLVNAASGNITIAFDSVTTFDNPVTIKKISASNTVTLDPYSTQLIDADTTLALTENNQTVTLEPDTTAAIWRRTNHVAAGVVGVSGDVVGTTGTQTLTNKTLTSPKINEDVALTAKASELNLLKSFLLKRSTFTYNGAATAYTIKVGAGAYFVKDKIAQWVAELTTSSIGTPGADTWYYLYLDYSAITSGTAITATELIWSSTAPTYSHTYRGWYNSDDLCIFAVLANSASDDILPFYHDGSRYVQWDQRIGIISNQIYATFTDVDLSGAVPAVSTLVRASFYGTYAGAINSMLYRPNGSSATHGVVVGTLDATARSINNTMDVYSDSSQVIEAQFSANGMTIRVDGWHLPSGM